MKATCLQVAVIGNLYFPNRVTVAAGIGTQKKLAPRGKFLAFSTENRDLIGTLGKAVRDQELKFGIYYSLYG
jgi:hypothetical protein